MESSLISYILFRMMCNEVTGTSEFVTKSEEGFFVSTEKYEIRVQNTKLVIFSIITLLIIIVA